MHEISQSLQQLLQKGSDCYQGHGCRLSCTNHHKLTNRPICTTGSSDLRYPIPWSSLLPFIVLRALLCPCRQCI